MKYRLLKPNYFFNQKGSALITALLITAIVAAIATAMAIHLRIEIRETELADNANRAYLDLQGVQAWGMSQLITNAGNNQINQTPEVFPQIMPLTDFHGAKISGSVQDAQGLFNINSLVNPNMQLIFARLLQIIEPNMDATQALQITTNIRNWLGMSNADAIYLRKKPPYRAAHQAMTDISELRLVEGISYKLYLALQPYLVALPNTDSRININNAPLPIIMLLSPTMTPDQATSIINCRNKFKGFNNIMDFQNNCIVKIGLTLNNNVPMITSSRYFLINGQVNINNQQLTSSSLVQRNNIVGLNNKNQISIQIIWQKFNTQ